MTRADTELLFAFQCARVQTLWRPYIPRLYVYGMMIASRHA